MNLFINYYTNLHSILLNCSIYIAIVGFLNISIYEGSNFDIKNFIEAAMFL